MSAKIKFRLRFLVLTGLLVSLVGMAIFPHIIWGFITSAFGIIYHGTHLVLHHRPVEDACCKHR